MNRAYATCSPGGNDPARTTMFVKRFRRRTSCSRSMRRSAGEDSYPGFACEPRLQLAQRQPLQVGLGGVRRPMTETSVPVAASIATTFTLVPMAVNSK